MNRVYSRYAYSDGPRTGCWWDETCPAVNWPSLSGDHRYEVAVIGAGFTGLSAALHLAEAGRSVVVLDAQSPGWGASGRNGGFCCLGGSKVTDAALDRRFGKSDRKAYRQTEMDAVQFVADLLHRLKIKADTHSKGETLLAHRPKDYDQFKRDAEDIADNLGIEPELIAKQDLASAGLAGPFHGAMTIPIGFGLNPRKYIMGMVQAAANAGADLFGHSAVTTIEHTPAGYRLGTGQGSVTADKVVIATNGYSSENVPKAMGGRYLPTQSNVLVTRPLSEAEIAAAGWSSDQMAYDTRNLLHYFRLMPDRRFLFGMRGGLHSSPMAEARARRSVRRDFERMFPAWRTVESPHAWSGLVCLTLAGLPFVGKLDPDGQIFAAFGYHGNGVAMGSYAGTLVAEMVMARQTRVIPRAMAQPPARFPLGRFRRAVLPPVYALKGLADR